MTPPKKRTVKKPGPGYRRPSTLSADGLTVGPLVGEASEDLGTYEFRDVPAPSGLLLPLVAGLERAAGPGGRWRARSSVEAGAKIAQRLATDIAAQHPEVTSIKDLTPEVFKDWRTAVETNAIWPGQINLARDTAPGYGGGTEGDTAGVQNRQGPQAGRGR